MSLSPLDFVGALRSAVCETIRPCRLGLMLGIVMGLAGCSRSSEPSGPSPLLIVGLDGATWDVLDPMLKAGELPTLAGLIDSGTRATLRSRPPLISPALWTTIASGKRREAHGIENFLVKRPGSYAAHHQTTTRRKTETLWTIADANGVDSGVVRWHVTFPAEPIRGFMAAFTYAGFANAEKGVYFPPDARAYIEQRRQSDASARSGFCKWAWELPETPPAAKADTVPAWAYRKRVDFVRNVCERDRDVARLWRWLAGDAGPPLRMVFFNGIDRVSHKFWKFGKELQARDRADVTPEQLRLFRDVVPAYYRDTDQMLAELLAINRGANVLIVSDHGFTDGRYPNNLFFQMDNLLRHLGHQTTTAEGIDWSKTRAFHLEDHFLHVRSIYLNVAGREANGTIPQASVAKVRAVLVEELGAIATAEGKRLFAEVRPGQAGDTSVGQPADIAYQLNPELQPNDRFVTAKGEVTYEALCFVNAFNSGRHHPDGIFIASGPSLRRGLRAEPLSILDVTPTALTLLGLPVGRDMDGNVATAVLAPSWLEDHPVVWLASHERARPAAAASEWQPVDAQAQETLRALGYVE